PPPLRQRILIFTQLALEIHLHRHTRIVFYLYSSIGWGVLSTNFRFSSVASSKVHRP
ncbi:hypothetical protein LINPERHAP2_LOCUS1150, partial [Linum perenne]